MAEASDNVLADPGVVVLLSPEQLRGQSYWPAARRPLHSLLFLIPLLAAYELGILAARSGMLGDASSVLAYDMVHDTLGRLGATRHYLPALSVVFILLFWHIVSREHWVIRRSAIQLMWVESLALAAPLVLFNWLMAHGVRLSGTTDAAVRAGWDWRAYLSDLAISIGAGVYEELIFRLLLMVLLSIVLIDLLGLKTQFATVLTILVSGLLFSLYHYLGGAHYSMDTFMFRWAAGIYLAMVFTARGFGIAVGAHALYDVLASTLNAV